MGTCQGSNEKQSAGHSWMETCEGSGDTQFHSNASRVLLKHDLQRVQTAPSFGGSLSDSGLALLIQSLSSRSGAGPEKSLICLPQSVAVLSINNDPLPRSLPVNQPGSGRAV